MIIIHIVASVSKINYGVWKAAIFASDYLKEKCKVNTELWTCKPGEIEEDLNNSGTNIFTDKELSKKGFIAWLNKYDKQDTVIVTHGVWLTPTKLGYIAKKQGFKWVYTPHGMYESWATNKGRFKKWVYFRFFEKRYSESADIIRAVSEHEKVTLEKKFRKTIILIPNGVDLPLEIKIRKGTSNLIFVFLSRLHLKKGVIFLVKAWSEVMSNHPEATLIIAGPDEGELKKIKPYLKNNIIYIGPVYGEEKAGLLSKSHYYLLPSFSEGFPTSVLEAMSYGVVPVVSEGCNIPDVFNRGLGYEIKPDISNIKEVLNYLISKDYDFNLSDINKSFIRNNYSPVQIGNKLYNLYFELLKS